MYQPAWNVYIWTDKDSPQKGKTRATVMDIKFNKKKGQNVYLLRVHSRQSKFLKGAFCFVESPKINVVRFESQIIERS